jgi:hypothetical protein
VAKWDFRDGFLGVDFGSTVPSRTQRHHRLSLEAFVPDTIKDDATMNSCKQQTISRVKNREQINRTTRPLMEGSGIVSGIVAVADDQ